MWTIIKYNLKNLSSCPIVILMYIIEFPVLLILLGTSIKMENGMVTSLIIFNKNFDDVETMVYMVIPGLVLTFILILVFLNIINTGGITISLLKNPISSIILTKNITRSKYIIAQYISYNLFTFLHMLIFCVLIFLISYFSFGVLMYKEVFLPGLYVVLLVISYSMIFSLLGMMVENETFITAFGLIIFFFLSHRITSITAEDGLLLNIIKSIFPPILYLQAYNKMIDIDSLDLFKIGLNGVYAVVYLLLTIIIYRKKDIS